MAAQEEEAAEIDEFAMFKARSLGVESEYLEMARVGLLRRSMRQRAPPLESMKHPRPSSGPSPGHQSYVDHNGIPGASEAHKFQAAREPFTHDEASTCGYLLPAGTSNFQRAHSFRAHRRAPGEKRPSMAPKTPTEDPEEPAKLSRQRNMTMPARRRIDQRAAAVAAAAAAAESENVRSRQQRHVGSAAEDDGVGGHHLVGDRSVLRVRNFTTKDGNIINRGDSIKIRRGTKASGLPSPLALNLPNFGGNAMAVPQGRDLKLSPRSGSLKGASNSSAFGVRKSMVASLTSSESHRPYSSSATHLAAGPNEGSSSEEVAQGQSPLRDPQLRGHRLSRQFQSQDEERLLMAGSNFGGQGQARVTESELSASTSSNLGSRGARLPSHSSSQHTQMGDEPIELEYLGESRLARDNSRRRSVRQQRDDGHASGLEEEQNENETEEGNALAEEQEGATEDEEQVVYKVVVMGSAGVGKTTLTHQMLTSEYLANNENEIDDDSTDKIVSVQIDGEESLLQLIDQPGQQGARRKDDPLHADAHLVVYSVTDRSSYAFAQSCLQDLRPAKRHNVVILVANKQELVRNRVISEEEGKSLAHKRHCKFIEVSALLSHKVDDLLVGVTRQIRLRKAVSGAGGSGGKSDSQSDGGKTTNSDSDVRIGCLQRAAMDIFRRITRRRRLVESTSCDDLFKP